MNPKVLMIDDDRDFCTLVHNVIGSTFDVEFRHTLREGLQAIKSVKPVAILVDLVLPDSVRGSTVLAIKRSIGDEALVVLSGHLDKETVKQVIDDNANGVVNKNKPLRFLPVEINNAIKNRNKCLTYEEAIKRLDDSSI